MCALWSWHVGAIAGAAGCCCRIFLRSSRRRSLARGEWLQRKELTKHKFWSCKCTKVQNWEVWGMIRVWFGHDSGYDSETQLFLNSGSFVAWVSFSHREPTTIATQWLQWLDLPDDLGQDLNMKNVRFKCTFMIYIRRPAGVSSGCSSHEPLVQLRLGLCSSSTVFWFGCQPASQPASQPHTESSRSSASSATQQAARHAASQLQLASPIPAAATEPAT